MKNTSNVFLNREIENEHVAQTLEMFSGLLEETTDFGIRLLDNFNKNISGKDEVIPISFSLRNILEILDSISILIKHSSVEPCRILLRTMLESYLTLEYILKENTKNRSLSLLVCHFNKKLKSYKRYNKKFEEGKRFFANLDIEKVNIDLSKIDTDREIQNLESLLKTELYKDVVKEYNKAVKSGYKNPNWYSLYNGPKNLEQLSKQLNLSTLYDVLYRYWSGHIHGTDLIDGKIKSAEIGKVLISCFRNPKEAQQLTVWCLNITIKTFKLFIQKYMKDFEIEYNKWYLTISPRFMEIISDKNFINVN